MRVCNKRLNMKSHLNLYILILTAFSLTSCGVLFIRKVETMVTKENGSIPPDFGKDSLTMICVIYGKNSYDKYLRKHVTNEYNGKYEFVLKDSLTNRKYSSWKYRYVFDTEIHETSATFYGDGSVQAGSMSGSYYIYDKFTWKKYDSEVASSFFAKLIQAYMIILEKERLKYHPKAEGAVK